MLIDQSSVTDIISCGLLWCRCRQLEEWVSGLGPGFCSALHLSHACSEPFEVQQQWRRRRRRYRFNPSPMSSLNCTMFHAVPYLAP